MNRQIPSIEGFVCERIRLQSLQPVDQDPSISLEGGLYPLYAIDELTLVAHRDEE
ncbi:hypothetical protein [Nesterenkonia pannonica]|uniref:hypothetical protein n=1 Tax=Nesterenkonia pannonica TaxID=1548602 RepID=UPI002164E5A9|nr:hypothetical protein [Nesterenkonia pannonica]